MTFPSTEFESSGLAPCKRSKRITLNISVCFFGSRCGCGGALLKPNDVEEPNVEKLNVGSLLVGAVVLLDPSNENVGLEGDEELVAVAAGAAVEEEEKFEP